MSNYLTQPLREAYWAIVKECLTRYHGLGEQEADAHVAEFRRDMANAPDDIDTDVVYNTEAFQLASDLAGRELDARPYWDEYLAMMDRIYEAYLDEADADNSPPGVLPAA